MFYLYFCSKEDEATLAVSVARLREIEPCARIFVGVDNDLTRRAQVPQGCHAVPIVLHRVPARPGMPAVAFELHSVCHMLGLMQTIMETYGFTHCFKLDANMFCNDMRQLLPGNTVARGRTRARPHRRHHPLRRTLPGGGAVVARPPRTRPHPPPPPKKLHNITTHFSL